MNPVRGIETDRIDHPSPGSCNFQINESRSRDWNISISKSSSQLLLAFKLMNPVRGIETPGTAIAFYVSLTFKLMNPVRGIETVPALNTFPPCWIFQINESRSRDWNFYGHIIVRYGSPFQINESRSRDWNVYFAPSTFPTIGSSTFKLMNPVRGIETR